MADEPASVKCMEEVQETRGIRLHGRSAKARGIQYVRIPPKRGRGAQAARQPRERTVNRAISNASVHDENPEVVAPVGQPPVNAPTANEMAMFEEFRRFQEFMRRSQL
ncbi:unnamed protein product [Arabidopsis thaliana]|uniref:Uncharacterized protein n=1 Tax=Arabidopsis thaliana TaxID=3702 RepID=A0A5S9RWP6_ARATH|nr:unnamed protein product [Arabidopsis thaliana]